jgi:hypothetical protein
LWNRLARHRLRSGSEILRATQWAIHPLFDDPDHRGIVS